MQAALEGKDGNSMSIFGIGRDEPQCGHKHVSVDGRASVKDIDDGESGNGDCHESEREVSDTEIDATKGSGWFVQRPSSEERNVSLRMPIGPPQRHSQWQSSAQHRGPGKVRVRAEMLKCAETNV